MKRGGALGYGVVSAFLKRLLDVGGAALLLLLGLPAWILLLLILGFVQGPPLFFRQERVGHRGQPLRVIKLRTMEVGTSGPKVTAGDDPRVTSVGKWLRRYRLDEWPQLLQVLRGEMALVGPRPEVARFVAHWDEEARGLLDLRPGLTDPATLHSLDEETQLRGRKDPESSYLKELMPQKLERSLAYFRDPSFVGDLRILALTLRRLVLRC